MEDFLIDKPRSVNGGLSQTPRIQREKITDYCSASNTLLAISNYCTITPQHSTSVGMQLAGSDSKQRQQNLHISQLCLLEKVLFNNCIDAKSKNKRLLAVNERAEHNNTTQQQATTKRQTLNHCLKSVLEERMPTSSAANGIEYPASSRRQSLKSAEKNGKVTVQDRKVLRRSSNTQDAQATEDVNGNSPAVDNNQPIDTNQNLLAVKHRRRTTRRRSSTSGTLLSRNEADQKADPGNGNIKQRRSSVSSSNPPSPRRGSMTSPFPSQPLQSLSPRRLSSGMKFTRRNSSTSASILSLTNKPDVYFQFPAQRPKLHEFNKNNYLKGGQMMGDMSSIRCLEFANEKDGEEKENIDKKLVRVKEERKHLETLQAAVFDWIRLLKGIHRLSKGVPLIRSITRVCLEMNKLFVLNCGAYGASLLALRRCHLPTVNQIAADIEVLRFMIEKGGRMLTAVDGKYLEDIRELLGRLEGTISTTLNMFY
eukprot:gene15045-16598_t